MSVLSEAIELLVHPPGDLVYFLVTLFALQQALIPASIARRFSPAAPAPRRWFWAVGGLLAGRIVLITVGLLGLADILIPEAWLPPLERLVEVIGITLVLWAMWSARPARWQTWVLLTLLLAEIGLFIYDIQIWLPQVTRGVAYNTTPTSWLWEYVALGLLSAALLLQLILRPAEWELAFGVLVVWLVGHALQLGWADLSLHVSGWGRLAALVTLPLLVSFIQRTLYGGVIGDQSTTGSFKRSLRWVTEANSAPELDFDGFQNLFEGIESARELEPALIVASSRIARLLGVDLCAITMPETLAPPRLRVVAQHPPLGLLESPVLDLAEYDALREAWSTGEPRVVQTARSSAWLARLFSEFGFREPGPLAVFPLQSGEKLVGMLLLGNPETGRQWTQETLVLPHLTAALLGGAIDRVQRQGESIFRLRDSDAEHETALNATRVEIARFSEQVLTLRQELDARTHEVADLHAQLEEQSRSSSSTESEFWQSEVRDLVRDRDVLIHERNRLGQELAKTRSHLEQRLEERRVLLRKLETLHTQLQATQAVPASMALGFLVADGKGAIVMADASTRQLLHLPQGDLVGLPLDGAFANSQWAAAVHELLSRGSDARQRIHLTVPADDHMIEADLMAVAGHDTATGAIVVTLRTEESFAERQEATMGIANELRTPMTSITGYTSLLLGEQAGILNDMQRQFLERVCANVEHMGQLLNDLIQVASPDGRSGDLTPEPVDPVGLIQDAVKGLEARFRERQLAVRTDLPPHLPAVRSDRDSLYQIMLRLLSNAALCSKEGTEIVIAGGIQATGPGQPPIIRISVTDTGGGVAEEDLPRVFRRFYRAGQPLIAGLGETGVGMAVAKTLVEANNGRIWVETQPGVGSTFTIALPACQSRE